jgi:hypothetical protein
MSLEHITLGTVYSVPECFVQIAQDTRLTFDSMAYAFDPIAPINDKLVIVAANNQRFVSTPIVDKELLLPYYFYQ